MDLSLIAKLSSLQQIDNAANVNAGEAGSMNSPGPAGTQSPPSPASGQCLDADAGYPLGQGSSPSGSSLVGETSCWTNPVGAHVQQQQQFAGIGTAQSLSPCPSGCLSPSLSSSAAPKGCKASSTGAAAGATALQNTSQKSNSGGGGLDGLALASQGPPSQQAAMAAAAGKALPAVTLPVVCGPVTGFLQVHRGRIVMDPDTPQQKEVSATEFERLGGRSATKKWRQSIRLLQPDGTPGRPVGDWYAQQGLDGVHKMGLADSKRAPATAGFKPATTAAEAQERPTAVGHPAALGHGLDAHVMARAAAAAAMAAAASCPPAALSQDWAGVVLPTPSTGPSSSTNAKKSPALPALFTSVTGVGSLQQPEQHLGMTPFGTTDHLPADLFGSPFTRPPASSLTTASIAASSSLPTSSTSASGSSPELQQGEMSSAYERTCAAMMLMAEYLSGKRASPPWDLLVGLGQQPVVCGQLVDLRRLFLLVLSRGGSELVSAGGGWEDVAQQMHLLPCLEDPSPGARLQRIHCDYLLRFERNAGPQNWAALLQLSVTAHLPDVAACVPPPTEATASGPVSRLATSTPPLLPTCISGPASCAAQSSASPCLTVDQAAGALALHGRSLQAPASSVCLGRPGRGSAAAGPAGLIRPLSPSCISSRPCTPPGLRMASTGVQKRRPPAGRSASEANLTFRVTAATERLQQHQWLQAQQDLPRRLSEGQEVTCDAVVAGDQRTHMGRGLGSPCRRQQQQQQAAGAQEADADWIPATFSQNVHLEEVAALQEEVAALQQKAAALRQGVHVTEGGTGAATSGTEAPVAAAQLQAPIGDLSFDSLTSEDWQSLLALVGMDKQHQGQPVTAMAPAVPSGAGPSNAGLEGIGSPLPCWRGGFNLDTPFASGAFQADQGGSCTFEDAGQGRRGVAATRAASMPEPSRPNDVHLLMPGFLPCESHSPPLVSWFQEEVQSAATGTVGCGQSMVASSTTCSIGAKDHQQGPAREDQLCAEEWLLRNLLPLEAQGRQHLQQTIHLDVLQGSGDYDTVQMGLLPHSLQQLQAPTSLASMSNRHEEGTFVMEAASALARSGAVETGPQPVSLMTQATGGACGQQQQQQHQEDPLGLFPLKGLQKSSTPMGAVLEHLLDSPSFRGDASWMDISSQLDTVSKDLHGAGPSEMQWGSGNWEAVLGAEGVLKFTG